MQINASEGQKIKKGQKLVLLEDGGSLEIQFMMKSTNVDAVAELPLIQIGALSPRVFGQMSNVGVSVRL